MKITFPHMGSPLIYDKLFISLGHDVIVPRTPTKRTIDLGVKYSPEFACFPYKVLLGTYIEGIEKGANVVIAAGGSGPCRAGFYAELHQKTLRGMGYDVDFVIFDDIKRDPGMFLKNIGIVKGRNSWLKAAGLAWKTYKFARAVDTLQKTVEIRRAYELVKGSFNNTFDKIVNRFYDEDLSGMDINKIYLEGKARLDSLPCREIPEKNRIRIGIIGEIFVVLEPSVNMNIAAVLNEMGCEVYRSMYISDWVNHSTWPKVFKHRSGQDIIDKSKKYIEIGVGGHERMNIGGIINYKEMGFDGVIHLMPFACLPELVTQSMAPRITKDSQMPILTLALDEQTGIANNLTRIEAFVELLRSIKINRTANGGTSDE